MRPERDNQQWLECLRSEGPRHEEALSELRLVLTWRLRAAFRSRQDFVESMLEDIVQDSVLRVLAALHQFQDRSRFTTWATAIGVRVGMTELRKRRGKDVSLDQLVADAHFEPPSQETDVTTAASRAEIIQALDGIIRTRLTDKQRTVLLAEIRGMAQEEIARQLGTNRNALYKLSHDARLRVKKELEQAGFGAQVWAEAFT